MAGGANEIGPGVVEARRRALIAFAGVGAGIFAARFGPVLGSGVWFSLALGACAIALGSRGWWCRAALFAGVFLAAGGWYALRVREAPADRLDRLMPGGGIVCVEGLVLDTPRKLDEPREGLAKFRSHPASSRFDVAVEWIVDGEKPAAASGRVWVVSAGDPPRVRAGERVRLTGTLRPVDPPLNWGESDLRLYAAQEGYAGVLSVAGEGGVSEARTTASVLSSVRSWWAGAVEAWRQRARGVVMRAAGDDPRDPGRALLLGLVLGDYDQSSGAIRGSFARTGLAHILSISGFHLAVMAWVALVLVRLTGDRGFVEPLIVALLVLAYAAVVPSGSPILRSAAMVLAVLAGEAVGRRHDRVTLLLWIGVALLVWRPLDLWSLGYQLSLGLTTLLFWTGNAFHDRLWGVRIRTDLPEARPPLARAIEPIKASISAGVLCCLVSMPLLACRVGLVSPAAIAATVVVTPLIVLALWVAYGALILGMVIPGAAEASAWVLRGLCGGAVKLVAWIDRVPYSSFRVPPMPWAWGATATLVALYWVRRGTRRDTAAWCASAALLVWAGGLWWTADRLPGGVALRMDTLAVGDGSCHVLRANGGAVLWDCAPMDVGGAMPPVVKACREVGVWRTPTAVITHPDLDHFGGLPDAIEPLGVRRVVLGERFVNQAADQPRSAAAYLVDELKRRGVEIVVVKAGDTVELGEARITFLSPPGGDAWKIDNDESLVGLVEGRGVGGARPSILMTGDIQDDAIHWLEESQPKRKPGVLELPHHGSARPASIRWVGSLRPGLVMQSTGPRRVNDPRWDGVRAGSVWYTTAADGAAWAEVRRDGTLRHGCVRDTLDR